VGGGGHGRRHPRQVRKARGKLKEQVYDLVLQAVRPGCRTAKRIGADKAGRDRRRPRLHPGRHPDAHQRAAHLRDRRHRRQIRCWRTRRCTRRHVAAEVRFGRPCMRPSMRGRDPEGVAYTDPEVAWVGLTEDEAKGQGHQRSRRACSRGTLSGRGDRQRPRRRLHQAAVQRGRDACDRRRRQSSARTRGDNDRRGGRGWAIEIGALDGVDIGQDDPPAPDPGRVDRHGRRRCTEGACARTCRRTKK